MKWGLHVHVPQFMFMHLVSILRCGFQNEVRFERLGCASMETMTSDIASQCSPRWQLLSEDWNAVIGQTNPKQNPKLLTQMLPTLFNIPNYRKKMVWRQTRERLGSEKRGCGSNDEGNHFIPIPPAQIFLTREITELQRFLSEDD